MQALKKFFVGVFEELWPPVLFFFTALFLIAVIFKLLVQEYAVVQVSAFVRAAVLALIAAKGISLVAWAESGYKADLAHRRIVVVAVKTVAYALTVIAFGVGEKFVEAYRGSASLGAGFTKMIANTNLDHFLGMVLLISVIVFFYLALQEIEKAMGEGALFRLFFKLPDSAAGRLGVLATESDKSSLLRPSAR